MKIYVILFCFLLAFYQATSINTYYGRIKFENGQLSNYLNELVSIHFDFHDQVVIKTLYLKNESIKSHRSKRQYIKPTFDGTWLQPGNVPFRINKKRNMNQNGNNMKRPPYFN